MISKLDKNDRRDFWNEGYFKYWKDRVDEANKGGDESEIVKGDVLTSKDIQLEDAINRLVIKTQSILLEIGCGFGRSLPILSKLCEKVYATDISQRMIDVAKEKNRSLNNILYFVSEAESLDFKSGTFDYILCYGVFDALNQESALRECNRLLKKGGRLLFTGKNSDYMDDDNLAIEAEIAARRKNQPNFFTDAKKICSHQNELGFSLFSQKYFIFRGDFSKDIFTTYVPEKFYEFEMILEKTNYFNSKLIFSNEYSKTFLKRENQ